MTTWKLTPVVTASPWARYRLEFKPGQDGAQATEVLLTTEMHADLSPRLAAEPDSDPETCPLDHTCDEDEICNCWCDGHDCPAAECPSFRLVTSRLRDAAEKLADARAATLRSAADALLRYAENYPEDVFPADSTSRDGIGGTAMRHAYKNAADMILNGGGE
jgi:hypothetical protein